jgi:uroporphyrinogen decarboxylase
VRREVELRKKLFPDGGLIVGPTHTIQPDTPVENILALYQAAGSLQA